MITHCRLRAFVGVDRCQEMAATLVVLDDSSTEVWSHPVSSFVSPKDEPPMERAARRDLDANPRTDTQLYRVRPRRPPCRTLNEKSDLRFPVLAPDHEVSRFGRHRGARHRDEPRPAPLHGSLSSSSRLKGARSPSKTKSETEAIGRGSRQNDAGLIAIAAKTGSDRRSTRIAAIYQVLLKPLRSGRWRQRRMSPDERDLFSSALLFPGPPLALSIDN